jgi:putative ABC transport system permease protein
VYLAITARTATIYRWAPACNDADVIQDLRHAGRMLRRNPGFTIVAILALAVGIGANTAVFTVVNGVLLRPLPFPESGRLFLISNLPRRSPFPLSPGLIERDYLEFRRNNRSFEGIATFSSLGAVLTGAGDPVRVPTAAVTPDFFAVLRMSAGLGRTFGSGDDREHIAILSDNLWRNRFGADPRVIGRTITLDGVARTVVGVMPPGFSFPPDAQLWTPLEIRVDPHNATLRPVLGRLKPGVSRQQAQSELEALVTALPPEHGEKRGDSVARIVPLKELVVGDVRGSLLIFSGAVAFVLLIACANVANLLLMRVASRRQEVSVRAALGAGRWRLIRQLLTESTLLSLAGAAAGLVVALWTVPVLLALAPPGKLPRANDVRIDGWVLGATLLVSVLTGIVSGLAPAFRISRRDARLSNVAARVETGRRERLRAAFVITEVALAVVLLSGAGLMLRSFLWLRTVNPGFRPENVLTMTIELPPAVYKTAAQMRAFHDSILAKLSAIPGVAAAGAVNWRPLGGMLIKGDFQVDGGRTLPRNYMVDKPAISPGYFRAMGIRMLRGRDFDPRDNESGPGVAIVSESVARRLWPGEEPIGKRISMEDHAKPKDWLTVVGVVDDIRQQTLRQPPDSAIYRPYLQVSQPFFLSHMTFVVRTGPNPQSAASAMLAAVRETDKDQPAETIATMQDLIAATTAEPLFETRLLAAFSTIALLLAAIGIYGVLAYSVTERTREIGIRMALGAVKSDVVGMVLRHTLALAGVGIVFGLAGAFAVSRVLAKFLFNVSPTDAVTLLSVTLLLAGVALMTAWIPARRAAGVDPAVALRYE